MPAEFMPTYGYTPIARYGTPAKVRTCSSRRARLWAGGSAADPNGTYFRVREPGLQGNQISAELIVFNEGPAPGTPPDPENPPDAIFVVVNRTLAYSEDVTGPAEVKFLDINQARWSDLWTIETSDSSPHAKYNSIRVEIRNEEPPVVEDLGPFAFDKLFTKPKISVQLSKKTTPGASETLISIAPRYRFYRLKWVETVPEPEEPGSGGGGEEPPAEPTAGWDIADPREQINANDPWIEVIERTPMPEAPAGGAGPAPERGPLNDAQDEGEDGVYLHPFPETYFSGGDGLPDTPTPEKTGPTRALVHVNYGETKNGSLAEANLMYEWVGESAKVGSWKLY